MRLLVCTSLFLQFQLSFRALWNMQRRKGGEIWVAKMNQVHSIYSGGGLFFRSLERGENNCGIIIHYILKA